jgi:hypothetical protein
MSRAVVRRSATFTLFPVPLSGLVAYHGASYSIVSVSNAADCEGRSMILFLKA